MASSSHCTRQRNDADPDGVKQTVADYSTRRRETRQLNQLAAVCLGCYAGAHMQRKQQQKAITVAHEASAAATRYTSRQRCNRYSSDRRKQSAYRGHYRLPERNNNPNRPLSVYAVDHASTAIISARMDHGTFPQQHSATRSEGTRVPSKRRKAYSLGARTRTSSPPGKIVVGNN
ncbi:hypothetical protein MRX96_019727 [Rhipicephalus microplus]